MCISTWEEGGGLLATPTQYLPDTGTFVQRKDFFRTAVHQQQFHWRRKHGQLCTTGGPSPRFCTRLPPPPPTVEVAKAPWGGGIGGGVQGGAGGGEGQWGGGSRWANLGWWWRRGGGEAQAPLTSPCPPSNHTITINLTLTFAASWFGHASHVDWAEQDPPNFVHGCFCHIIALHFGPQHSL